VTSRWLLIYIVYDAQNHEPNIPKSHLPAEHLASRDRRVEGKNNSKKYLLESQRFSRLFVDDRIEYGDDDDDDDDEQRALC
jgi:hypothetical protein